MKTSLLALLLTILTGCAFTNAPQPPPPAPAQDPLGKVVEKIKPVEEKVSSDIAETKNIGTIVNRPEIVQCADYIQKLQNIITSSNEMVDKLRAEDTRNLLVSSLLKDYFIIEFTAKGGQDVQADFQKNFPIQCGAVQSVVNQQIFRAMLRGATKGGAGGFNLPGLGN